MYRHITRTSVMLGSIRGVINSLSWLITQGLHLSAKRQKHHRQKGREADIELRRVTMLARQTADGSHVVTIYDPVLNAVLIQETDKGGFQSPVLTALPLERIFKKVLTTRDPEKLAAFMKLRPFRKLYKNLKRRMVPVVKDDAIIFALEEEAH